MGLLRNTKIIFLVGLCVVVFFGFLVYNRVSIGEYIWNHYRADTLALSVVGQDSFLKKQIAEFYFNGGAYDLEKARKYYRELHESGVRDHDVLFQLGRIAFINRDFNRALDFLNLQLELYPEQQRGEYIKGLVFMYTGEFNRAQESFQKFVVAYPNEWAGYNDLAWAYFKTGSYENMARTAQKGLEISPDNPWLHNMLGVAQWNLGELSEAEMHLTRVESLVSQMTPEEWGGAYPGNDPTTYAASLEAMRTNVATNLTALRAEKKGD